MTNTKKIFEYQIWHLLSLAILLISIKLFLVNSPDTLEGSLWGISTSIWFWIAMIIPILHQVYVWFVWRLELYQNTFSDKIGTQSAFRLYVAGFSILFVGRLISIVLLSASNKDTLNINPGYTYALAAFITPFVIYLFYSVKKYFTVERAYGIDHFDKDYNEPYVKKGIFKYTANGMYIVGLSILYLPGLLLLSKGGLLVALFNHIYIWVHYYFTERPDMVEIYGNAP